MSSTRSPFQIYSQSLALAGSMVVQGPLRVFRFASAEDASGNISPAAKVLVKAGPEVGPSVPLRVGNAAFFKEATEITVTWLAQAGITGVFFISPDQDTADLDSTPPVQLLAGTITLSRATGVSATAQLSVSAASSTTVLAADTSRRSCWIKAHPSNVNPIWIAGAVIFDTYGIPLWPGEEIFLEGGGQISVFNPGAVAALVSRLSVAD